MKFWFFMVLALVAGLSAMGLAFTSPPALLKWAVMILAAFFVFFCARQALRHGAD